MHLDIRIKNDVSTSEPYTQGHYMLHTASCVVERYVRNEDRVLPFMMPLAKSKTT